MRELGIAVSLGTDSTASNDSIDMFAEMRLAVAQQRLSASDAFRMATIEGARALGLDQYLGSLAPGKRADFAVIGLKGTVADPTVWFVSSGDRNCVKATFLGGTPVSLDDAATRNEVERLRQKVECA
jgi:5-methylthioadenosine/S-adenosylhomocysteine deaminase